MSADADDGTATGGGGTLAGREREWEQFEYYPSKIATAVALGASFVTVAVLAPGALLLSVGAGLGTAVLIAGLVRGSHTLVTVGAGAMLASLVAVAATGGSAVRVVVAGVAVLLAFDAGRYAVQLGRQVGRRGPTARAELYHLGVTVAVSVAVAVVGTVVFLVAPEQQPGIVLLPLLLAGVLLISALVLLGDSDDE